jgi:saccharopine dehydrogenase-like NADP-dependent oxidoreductase
MESGIASMSRTTGYTATATINLILDGHFSKVGVFPPELVGSINGCWNYIKTYLNNRGVYIKKV